jgi:hypothetical protein
MHQNQPGSFGVATPDRAVPALSATECQGERSRLLVRWSAKAAVILANGYVLFFFSERVFWSFPRPNDSLADLLVTWLVYSLLGWILLILVRRYRIASFLPLFLAGAVYGWIAEGVVVDTLYGSPGNPFPLSVSFTGLAWHALLSVGVGWYLLSKALTARRPTRTILISLAIGLGWGLWAAWWPSELGQQGATSLPRFAGHALVCSILFIGSWSLLGRARSNWFQAGRLETGFLFGLVALVFLCVRVPARPLAALILPPLLLLAAIGLRRSAGSEKQPDLLDGLLGQVRLSNAFALVLIPLAAIATYAPFRLLEIYPATNMVLYLATMPLGFWFFFRAVWHHTVRGI